MFKEYYSRRFEEILGSAPQPSEGLGDDVIQAKMLEYGLTLPKALFDYYALAGVVSQKLVNGKVGQAQLP